MANSLYNYFIDQTFEIYHFLNLSKQGLHLTMYLHPTTGLNLFKNYCFDVRDVKNDFLVKFFINFGTMLPSFHYFTFFQINFTLPSYFTIELMYYF